MEAETFDCTRPADVFTTDEVAALLRIAPLTVRREVGRGKLAAHRFGRALRFTAADVNAYVESMRTA